MNKSIKEIARYILLALLMMGAYEAMLSALELEQAGKLTMQYAGIVGIYLGVWGYIIKWFFTSTVDEKQLNVKIKK